MEKQDLQQFFDKVQSDKDDFFLRFCSAMRAGENALYHKVASRAITLNEGWLDTLEQALFSVEKIVRNPRKFIIDEEMLVDVARAKRITPKTVRHLSSNSQFVQSIEPNGDIRPKKLLTTEMSEDLAIYENRFICTLVHHLVTFVERRYNDIAGKLQAYDQTTTGMTSTFRYGDAECELKLDYSIRETPKNEVLLQKNVKTMARITQLRARLKVLLNTAFIQELSARKPVYPPIMKTNLITMNVDYNNCYNLWLYISSYQTEELSVAFQEKKLPVESEFYDDLTMIGAMSFQALFLDHVLNGKRYTEVPYSPLKEKKYRNAPTTYEITPDFKVDKSDVGEDVINEYYFKAMKKELAAATKPDSKGGGEKQITLSFSRFCRALAKINGEMYRELIEKQLPGDENLLEGTAIQKKTRAVKRQQAYLRRCRQLSTLKREEFEKILKLEAREQLKLEKLQEALDKERGKQKAIRNRKKTEKARQERIKQRANTAEKSAKLYEEELRAKEAERLERLRQKREEAKRARELKMLEMLKEKYDEGNGDGNK